MPELPEVETVVNGLKEQILHKKIEQITASYPNILQDGLPVFARRLQGRTIEAIERFGKYILMCFDDQQVVRIHLRMEGKFFLTREVLPQSLAKHVHVIFHFTDGSMLQYHDVRKFGTFELIERQADWHQDSKFAQLGFEPWEAGCTSDFLYDQMQRSRQKIKPFLLTQKNIVGLGNIYVDEVLFLSRIHPSSITNTLSKEVAATLICQAHHVLERAIALGGSTIRTYHNTLGIDGRFQNELQVHLRKGEPCFVCNTTIIKCKIGGRGTYICPQCQKEATMNEKG